MAMEFSGSNQLDSPSNFTAPTCATVCAWVLADVLSGSKRWIGYDTYWEMRSSGTSMLMELLQGGGGTPTYTGMVTGQWYHFAGVYCNTYKALYTNGTLTEQFSVGTVPSGNNLSIGQRYGASTSERWNGKLDDVRIYNRRLSDAELETLYNARGRDGIINGLLHRWKMDEGAPGVAASGTGVVKDLVGGLNMNPVSSPTWAESILNPGR